MSHCRPARLRLQTRHYPCHSSEICGLLFVTGILRSIGTSVRHRLRNSKLTIWNYYTYVSALRVKKSRTSTTIREPSSLSSHAQQYREERINRAGIPFKSPSQVDRYELTDTGRPNKAEQSLNYRVCLAVVCEEHSCCEQWTIIGIHFYGPDSWHSSSITLARQVIRRRRRLLT